MKVWECGIKGVLRWFIKISVASEKGRGDVDGLRGLKEVGNCHCGVETVHWRPLLGGGMCTGPLEFGESW